MQFKVTDGQTYTISFKHLRDGHNRPSNTRCQIGKVLPDGAIETLAIGESKRNKKDNPCKEAGRKASLKRALLNLQRTSLEVSLLGDSKEQRLRRLAKIEKSNKAFRKEVWNAYFGRKRTLSIGGQTVTYGQKGVTS